MAAAHSYRALDAITSDDIQALGIPPRVAEELHGKLTEIIANYGAATPLTWHNICKRILHPDLPFSFHQMLYYGCYRDFGPDPPAWIPDPEAVKLTNVGQLLERRGKEFLGSKYKDPMSSFSDFHEFSISNPEVYWKTVLDELSISFSAAPQRILHESSSNPGGYWLPGATVNPVKNCLSLNSKRDLNDIVIRWRDEGDDNLPVRCMTLKELREEVCHGPLLVLRYHIKRTLSLMLPCRWSIF